MSALKDANLNEMFNVEQPFNKPSGEMPYALYNPETEGKLWWFCSTDEEGKILSMYLFEHEPGNREKDCHFLSGVEEAKYYRQGLLDAGWLIPKMPEIVFKYADEKKPSTPNRKERRRLEKQNKKK